MRLDRIENIYFMVIMLLGLGITGILSTDGYAETPPSKIEPPSGYAEDSNRFGVYTALEGTYIYSDLNSSGGLSGGSIKAMIAPRYSITDRTMFICMYDGNYYKKREFYSDDIGPRLRVEYQGHSLTSMLRIKINNRYVVSPSLFYTATFNKDVDDTLWEKGLYNYNDIGAGLDFTDYKLGTGPLMGVLKAGMQVYHREYPNYNTLLDLAIGNAVEKDEKDYIGILTGVKYTCSQKTGFSWLADYNLLFKMLDDKKVVQANGELSGAKRYDHMHLLTAKVWYTLPEGFTLGFDLENCLYKSNQNFYDGMGTPGLNDDVPMEHYYDYWSYSLRPSVAYTLPNIPLTTRLSYAHLRTNYLDRKAKFTNGSYKFDDKQWEKRHEVLLDVSYQLNRQIGFAANWQYVKNESNNDDERVYQYDYQVNNYTIGARCTYTF